MRSIPRPYNYRSPVKQPGTVENVFGELRVVPEEPAPPHTPSDLAARIAKRLLTARERRMHASFSHRCSKSGW